MVTVLPITEFDRLLQFKELRHSSNIDFIKNQELKGCIKKMLAEKTGLTNPQGFITVVLSNESASVTERILDKTNKFNQILPRPNKPVYLQLRTSTDGICIDPDSLLEVEELDLSDEQTREFLPSFFEEQRKGVQYFFVPVLNIVNVEGVFYDKSLEEEIRRIQQGARTQDLLFQPISLF